MKQANKNPPERALSIEPATFEAEKPSWRRLFGGLRSPGIDVRTRQRLIDREFSQVDLASWR